MHRLIIIYRVIVIFIYLIIYFPRVVYNNRRNPKLYPIRYNVASLYTENLFM